MCLWHLKFRLMALISQQGLTENACPQDARCVPQSAIFTRYGMARVSGNDMRVMTLLIALAASMSGCGGGGGSSASAMGAVISASDGTQYVVSGGMQSNALLNMLADDGIDVSRSSSTYQYAHVLSPSRDAFYEISHFTGGAYSVNGVSVSAAGTFENTFYSTSSRTTAPVLQEVVFVAGGSQLQFIMQSNAMPFAADVVTVLDSAGGERQFSVVNGYVQSLQSAPLFNANVPVTAPASFDVDLTQITEFGNAFSLYASTHHNTSNALGQGNYVLAFSDANNPSATIQFNGSLVGSDDSVSMLWRNPYYFDSFSVQLQNAATPGMYTVNVSDGTQHQSFNTSGKMTVTMSVNGSALQRPYMEWVIENNNIFVGTDPLFYDQNNLFYSKVPEVWAQGYTGEGVSVLVVESSIDVNHEDLINNVDAARTSVASSPSSHGTLVSGVIAAEAGNGKGLAGVAPDASLINQGGWLSMDFFNNTPARVWNNSWGPTDSTGVLGQYFASQDPQILKQAAEDEDIIVVFANGNGGSSGEMSSYDAYINSIYTVSAQAIQYSGQLSSYAEQGPNITGSFYNDNDFFGRSSDGIVTTANNNAYSANFSGTSSAAPMASGVIALMLEANSDIDWRDVVSVFARVGKNNDPLDDSWQVNLAGIDYSHKYGFGVIHADAAVAGVLNSNYIVSDSALQVYDPASQADNQTLAISGRDTDLIEFIEVTLDINGVQSNQDDWAIKLTHQSDGKSSESTLATAHTASGALSYDNWEFSSVVHWGESITGDWSLSVTDRSNNDVSAAVSSWDIEFFYHQ